MLAQLNGIFAFAIWDTVKRELCIARDGLGVKLLYYAETDAGFIFASEIKAILQAAEINREIDPIALRNYLTYLWCPAPRMPPRQVKKLEPGCALTVCEGRVERHWRFYELPLRLPMVSLFECEAIDTLTLRAWRTAVQRQMVADVPVGAFRPAGWTPAPWLPLPVRLRPKPACSALPLR